MNANLAAYSVSGDNSRGRQYPEETPAYRQEFQRDRDRIVHSAAFRRLEYKTQVFVNHEGDMFRTRLTHSIEVAQIARTVARVLGLNEDLTEAIALAHDLGHTPFGHAGQNALNQCMAAYGGFEHNLQSLRVVDVLEERYPSFPGLNLCFETREGILKHCPPDQVEALGDVAERFRTDSQPTLEAQIANLADEIAYNNHDLDDGLRAGLLEVEMLHKTELFARHYQAVGADWPELGGRGVIHEVVRRMVNEQVVNLIENSQAEIAEQAPCSIDDVRAAEPMIVLSDAMAQAHRDLKRFLNINLYRHYRVHRMSRKAQTILRALFETFVDDLSALPPDTRLRAQTFERADGAAGRARAVTDYIAGMTDRFAIAEYGRLFNATELT